MAVTYLGSGFMAAPTVTPKSTARLPDTAITLFGVAIVPGLAGWRTRRYFMRAKDSTGSFVEWTSNAPDPNGVECGNSNKPFTDAVIVGIQ